MVDEEAADPPANAYDVDAPLLALEWKNVTVKAVLVGVTSASKYDGQVFPVLDERLPHRRGVRVAFPPAEKILPRMGLGGKAAKVAKVDDEVNDGVIVPDHGAAVMSNMTNGIDPSGKPRTKHCHICNKAFHKTNYLKRHVLSHSTVKPHKCNICGWGFFQHSNLTRHMASHKVTDRCFKCSHCDASFSTKSVLSMHLREAHGGKVLEPPRVEQLAEQKPLRGASVLKPQEEYPTSPEVSDQLSDTGTTTQEQPKGFTCTLCQASFDKVSALNKHIKSHPSVTDQAE